MTARLLQVDTRGVDDHGEKETSRRKVMTVTSVSGETIADLAAALVSVLGSFTDVRVVNVDLDWPSAWVRVTRSADGSRYYEELSPVKRRGWKRVLVPPGMLKSLARGFIPVAAGERDQLPRVRCDQHGFMRPVSINGRVVRYKCDLDKEHVRLVTIP